MTSSFPMAAYCPGCMVTGSNIMKSDRSLKSGPSLQFYKCVLCSQEWFDCTSCSSRITFVELKDIAKNHAQYCKKKVIEKKRKEREAEEDITESPHYDHNDESSFGDAGRDPEMEPDLVNIPVQFLGFRRPGTQQYFTNLHQDEAINRLVETACFGPAFADNHPLIDPSEKRLHILMTDLCYGITRTEREKLAEVLRLTVLCSKRQEYERIKGEESIGMEADSAFPPAAVPTVLCTEVAQMRNLYLRDKNAIVTNLPRQDVRSYDEHAYVSLIESIRCALASEPFENTGLSKNHIGACSRTVDNRNVDSPRWFDMLRQTEQLEDHQPGIKTMTLWINEWSDDFEPNQTKTNRGSVWMKTSTFGWRTKSSDRTVVKTVPIALGHKHKNHEVVESLFKQELESLRSGKLDLFYHGGDKKMVRVYADLFASLQDQPERRGGAHLLGGNSQYHARWGYSADCYALRELLPACERCFLSLATFTYDSVEGCNLQKSECQTCLRWSLDGNSRLLNVEAPKLFPKSELVEEHFIRPFKLTFELLRGAMSKACAAIEAGSWTKAEATSFLRVHCINDDLIEDFVSIARLRYIKAQAEAKLASDRDEDEKAFLKLFADQPDIFNLPMYPSVWDRGTLLCQHIDVIMHLLFLGIQKGTMKTIRKWTKAMGKSPSFIAYTEVLSRFPSGVSWCEIEPYTGDKLGGWESMNFLGLARGGKWFYGPMESVMSGVAYTDPVTPVESWRKDTCVKWVQVRGLELADVEDFQSECGEEVVAQCKQLRTEKKSLDKAPVAFLRAVIVMFTKQNGGPPPHLKDTICSVNIILQLSRALQAMLARIMSPEVTEHSIQEVDRHIKIFLSILDKVDSSLKGAIEAKETRKKSKWKPKWITSYNFVCLLNLPDYMRELGCLRNLWEGDRQGEAYIGEVKPEIMMGLRTGWQLALMQKLVIKEALGTVIQQLGDDSKTPAGKLAVLNGAASGQQIPAKDYHTYKHLFDLRTAWQRRDPISCVKMVSTCPNDARASGVFGVILAKDNGPRFTLLSRECFDETQNGCHYHSWSLAETVEPWGNLIPVAAYMFLPHREKHSCYTAIDSEWREISSCGETYNLPTYNME